MEAEDDSFRPILQNAVGTRSIEHGVSQGDLRRRSGPMIKRQSLDAAAMTNECAV